MTRIFLSVLVIIGCMACNRSSKILTNDNHENLWIKIEKENFPKALLEMADFQKPSQYSLFLLNAPQIISELNDAPHRDDTMTENSTHFINFPLPNASVIPFRTTRTSLMEKELAAQFPELNTFEGKSDALAASTIRITRHRGSIDAIILSTEGTFYIDPILLDGSTYYIVYDKKDFINDEKDRFFEPSLKIKP